MASGWRWVIVVLVSAAYFVMALVWLPGDSCYTSDGAPTSFFSRDEEFLQHLNLSSSISFPRNCEAFLLEGTSTPSRENDKAAGDAMPDSLRSIQGWSGGEWLNPQSESNMYWTRLQRMLEGRTDQVGHEASFAVNQTAAANWLQWSSKSYLMQQIQALEGRLALSNFWDWTLGMELATAQASLPVELTDINPMTMAQRNLEVSLKGAYVDSGSERRLCMTGCAYRNDHDFLIDCGFVLKVTYPNADSTTASSDIEAELSSSRSVVHDPLSFSAFRIMGPNRPLVSESENLHNEHRQLVGESQVDPDVPDTYLENHYDDTYSGYH